MTEQIETLLRWNLLLGVVPVLVAAGVAHLAWKVRQRDQEFKESFKVERDKTESQAREIAVLQAQMENLKKDVSRLRDIHNQLERG